MKSYITLLVRDLIQDIRPFRNTSKMMINDLFSRKKLLKKHFESILGPIRHSSKFYFAFAQQQTFFFTQQKTLTNIPKPTTEGPTMSSTVAQA